MGAFRVLYTKQLTKKRKTYADGFVVLRPSGAALLDEAGRELALAAGPLPAGSDWGEAEGVDVFEGFLVNGDGACGPEELPGAAGGGGGGGGGQPARLPGSPPAATQPLARPVLRRPGLAAPFRGAGSGGGAPPPGSAAAAPKWAAPRPPHPPRPPDVQYEPPRPSPQLGQQVQPRQPQPQHIQQQPCMQQQEPHAVAQWSGFAPCGGWRTGGRQTQEAWRGCA
jgi:hypothetical protein